MWSSVSEFRSTLDNHPHGGVAPLRRDLALRTYLERQAEHAAAESSVGLAPAATAVRVTVKAFCRFAANLAGALLPFWRASAVVSAIAIAELFVGQPADAADMQSLHVIEHAGIDAVTDIGVKGDSAGDLLTFNNEIFDDTDTKKIGTNNGWCIRVTVGKSWECFWTLMLKDGQITVEGPFLDAGDSRLAVTGGTGKYAGVRGEMLLHTRNADGSAYDFTYSLMY